MPRASVVYSIEGESGAEGASSPCCWAWNGTILAVDPQILAPLATINGDEGSAKSGTMFLTFDADRPYEMTTVTSDNLSAEEALSPIVHLAVGSKEMGHRVIAASRHSVYVFKSQGATNRWMPTYKVALETVTAVAWMPQWGVSPEVAKHTHLLDKYPRLRGRPLPSLGPGAPAFFVLSSWQLHLFYNLAPHVIGEANWGRASGALPLPAAIARPSLSSNFNLTATGPDSCQLVVAPDAGNAVFIFRVGLPQLRDNHPSPLSTNNNSALSEQLQITHQNTLSVALPQLPLTLRAALRVTALCESAAYGVLLVAVTDAATGASVIQRFSKNAPVHIPLERNAQVAALHVTQFDTVVVVLADATLQVRRVDTLELVESVEETQCGGEDDEGANDEEQSQQRQSENERAKGGGQQGFKGGAQQSRKGVAQFGGSGARSNSNGSAVKNSMGNHKHNDKDEEDDVGPRFAARRKLERSSRDQFSLSSALSPNHTCLVLNKTRQGRPALVHLIDLGFGLLLPADDTAAAAKILSLAEQSRLNGDDWWDLRSSIKKVAERRPGVYVALLQQVQIALDGMQLADVSSAAVVKSMWILENIKSMLLGLVADRTACVVESQSKLWLLHTVLMFRSAVLNPSLTTEVLQFVKDNKLSKEMAQGLTKNRLPFDSKDVALLAPFTDWVIHFCGFLFINIGQFASQPFEVPALLVDSPAAQQLSSLAGASVGMYLVQTGNFRVPGIGFFFELQYLVLLAELLLYIAWSTDLPQRMTLFDVVNVLRDRGNILRKHSSHPRAFFEAIYDMFKNKMAANLKSFALKSFPLAPQPLLNFLDLLPLPLNLFANLPRPSLQDLLSSLASSLYQQPAQPLAVDLFSSQSSYSAPNKATNTDNQKNTKSTNTSNNSGNKSMNNTNNNNNLKSMSGGLKNNQNTYDREPLIKGKSSDVQDTCVLHHSELGTPQVLEILSQRALYDVATRKPLDRRAALRQCIRCFRVTSRVLPKRGSSLQSVDLSACAICGGGWRVI